MSIGAASIGAQPIGATGVDRIYTPAQSIPLALNGSPITQPQSIQLRLLGLTPAAAQSVPLSLHAVDEADLYASAARWGLSVMLGGADLSDRISGPVRIKGEENASTLCDLEFLPAAGVIDPEQYEQQALIVDWLAVDAAGAELYRFRQYMGTTEEASYDPDIGVVNIRATTDLQRRFEEKTRAQIDALIPGGLWSEHVFDDTADGWQYAQDRLSTTPAEIHISPYGALVVTPWAAKATPDVTLTDAGRFSNTLKLTRATRRDLLTRYDINLDFRFVRLRHREISVQLVDIPFCEYLRQNFPLPSRDMVSSAAESGSWVRTSDISFVDLPLTGTYCAGLNWVKNASDDERLCLGARWTAARRWAQTVTELYTLTVTAPDLAEGVGEQAINADYGIEATYDATEYERDTDYDSAPGASIYDPDREDYIAEATDAEQDGRVAMQAAQQCALAMARTEILGRARKNRLSVGSIFRPDVDLANTVRIQTPYLTAQGKIAAYTKVMDPTIGALDMTLTLALSRHGGSGLASNTPLDASNRPDITSETPTERTHALGLRLGKKAGASADDGSFDGYFCNIAPNGQDYDATAVEYSTRLMVRMPEIEDAARQAVDAPIVTEYEVAVPEDTLTMEA